MSGGEKNRKHPLGNVDKRYLQGLRLSARGGNCMAMAEFASMALEGGAVVEAFYWAQVAELHGHGDIAPFLESCMEIWRSLECPEQHEYLSAFFDEHQRQFGFCALLYRSGIDPIYARSWFMKAAHEGDPDAKAFLMLYQAADPGRVE